MKDPEGRVEGIGGSQVRGSQGRAGQASPTEETGKEMSSFSFSERYETYHSWSYNR